MSGRQMTPARRAVLAQRAAAARRRAFLTLGLIAATVVLIVVGATTALSPLLALIPAALTVTVMVLGRRAVLANERADAARAQREARRTYPAREMTPTERKLAGRPVPAVRTGEQRTVAAAASEDLSTTVMSRVEASMFAKKHATGSRVSREVQRGATAASAVPARTARSPRGNVQGSVGKPSAASTLSAASPATAASPAAAPATPASASAGVPAGAQQSAAPSPQQASSPQQAPSSQQAQGWTSTPVPPPVYTAKAAAPRWEPASITTELQQITKARMEQIARESELRAASAAEGTANGANEHAVNEHGENEHGGAAAHIPAQPLAVPVASPDSLGVSLNSVLAKRRAV